MPIFFPQLQYKFSRVHVALTIHRLLNSFLTLEYAEVLQIFAVAKDPKYRLRLSQL